MENTDKFVSNLRNFMLRYSEQPNVWVKKSEFLASVNTHDNILHTVRQEWKTAPRRKD